LRVIQPSELIAEELAVVGHLQHTCPHKVDATDGYSKHNNAFIHVIGPVHCKAVVAYVSSEGRRRHEVAFPFIDGETNVGQGSSEGVVVRGDSFRPANNAPIV
jgi:hypothetical protein